MTDHLFIVEYGYSDEACRDDAHTFEPGEHRLLKDVEVAILLGFALDVSLFVESTAFFDVNVAEVLYSWSLGC